MCNRVTAFLAVTLMLTGCEELPSLPSVPDDLDRGISIYEHANYLGGSAQITTDIGDLKSFTGACGHYGDYGATYDWNDCVSSIHVAPGWRAIVFRDDDFSGERLEVTTTYLICSLCRGPAITMASMTASRR
jgi:hypothetical protein